MKKYSYAWMWITVLVVSLSSCQVVGGIFKAGMWVGVIIVVAIIMLILWLFGRGRR